MCGDMGECVGGCGGMQGSVGCVGRCGWIVWGLWVWGDYMRGQLRTSGSPSPLHGTAPPPQHMDLLSCRAHIPHSTAHSHPSQGPQLPPLCRSSRCQCSGPAAGKALFGTVRCWLPQTQCHLYHMSWGQPGLVWHCGPSCSTNPCSTNPGAPSVTWGLELIVGTVCGTRLGPGSRGPARHWARLVPWKQDLAWCHAQSLQAALGPG